MLLMKYVLIHVRAFAEPTAPLLEAGVRYIIQETDCLTVDRVRFLVIRVRDE